MGEEGGQHRSFSTPVTSVLNCVSSTFPSTEIHIPGLQTNQMAEQAAKILALLLGQHHISLSLLGKSRPAKDQVIHPCMILTPKGSGKVCLGCCIGLIAPMDIASKGWQEGVPF